MLLKDRPVKSVDGGGSDTIYIRGLPRSESDECVLKLLSELSPPLETDLSLRPNSGEVWAKYSDVSTACKVIQILHHRTVNSSILSVKYELGLDDNGKRLVDRSSHTTIIRNVGLRKDGDKHQSTKKQKLSGTCVVCQSSNGSVENCICKNVRFSSGRNAATVSAPGVSYTSNSICVGDTEYPFPSGMYLSRVIELTSKLSTSNTTNTLSTASTATVVPHPPVQVDPLLSLLTDTRSMGNKYAKEISETMAMVDAVQRAISLLPPEYKTIATSAAAGTTNTALPTSGLATIADCTSSVRNTVDVYVLGDGKRPLCAAAACLHLPGHFTFYSIDPLMMPAYSCIVDKASVDGIEKDSIQPNEHFGVYKSRFFPLPRMSQDFTIPTSASTPSCTNSTYTSKNAQLGLTAAHHHLSIVVSCHSHAPLQEFWQRLRGPKVAVTMACCAEYAALYSTNPTMDAGASTNGVNITETIVGTAPVSETVISDVNDRALQYAESMALPTKKSKKSKKSNKMEQDERNGTPIIPVLEFDDYEVYSPKRRVKIYFDLDLSG